MGHPARASPTRTRSNARPSNATGGDESPVRIFREAGLDPRIIGNKRIERCIARWKREPPDAGTTRPHAPAADAGREGRPAPMSVVLAQTMRINALEERLRRLELSLADGTTR
ncbi:hypothetical protein [Bifidobacterium longum]|uniref:hypothetical protein n=1 Tax=Bifidobacterium longum TaxID=216816 RepID=UPI00025E3494|nr:hypothetical protein HMPREF1314_1308 [Bifidobacterium longum subsp. longum 35B]